MSIEILKQTRQLNHEPIIELGVIVDWVSQQPNTTNKSEGKDH